MHSEDHEARIQASVSNFVSIIQRFGFWPSQSVVAQWLGCEGEIFVQRMDIPTNEMQGDWLEAFIKPVHLHAPTAVEIWITTRHIDQSDLQFLIFLINAVNELDVEVLSGSMICRSRIRSISCIGCENDHRWNPGSDLSILAKSRAELENEFGYRPELGVNTKVTTQAREQMDPESVEWRDQEVKFILQIVESSECLTDSMIARVCCALQEVRVRDAFLWDVAAGHVSSGSAAIRLSTMLLHVTGDLAVPIATVAGTCWWVSGNGAKANMCVDRANEGSHGYGLASLVQAALNVGLSPEFWVDTVMELSRDECLVGVKVA